MASFTLKALTIEDLAELSWRLIKRKMTEKMEWTMLEME